MFDTFSTINYLEMNYLNMIARQLALFSLTTRVAETMIPTKRLNAKNDNLFTLTATIINTLIEKHQLSK